MIELEHIDKITHDIFACACYRNLALTSHGVPPTPAVMALLHTDGAVDHVTEFDMDDFELLWVRGLGAIIKEGGPDALWDYAHYCVGDYIICPLTPSEAASLLMHRQII